MDVLEEAVKEVEIVEKKVFDPGIYQISNADYHGSTGISRSGISELQKSPLHYWDRYINPKREPKKATAAMTLGSAVHTLVLEPEKFADEFILAEKFDLRKNVDKARKLEFDMLANGKILLNEDDYHLAEIMANAVLTHRIADQILYGSEVEQSLYWVDEASGILCKARPDIWNKEINVLGDLKTARDSTPSHFSWAAKDGNYHIQAAMQIDAVFALTGKRVDQFVFIVVQNERPYKPYIYNVDNIIIEAGRREYKAALQVFKKCFESNDWSRDRNKILPLVFTDFQLSHSLFYKLTELYQCPI